MIDFLGKDGSGEINVLAPSDFSLNLSYEKNKSDSVTHQNSKIIANNNIDISGDNLSIKGGNIEANRVGIDVENLHIESMQDKNDASGFDVSVGFSTTNQNKSGNIGLGVSNNDKDWVNEQSSIIGIEKSDINVKGNTNIKGAVLGGGDTTLNTGTLSYRDIHDKEKGIDVGVEVSMDFGGKKSNDNKNGNAKSSSKISSGSLGYGATDREQINRGTIGKGTVIVGGIKVTPGINRDEGKSQEVTKDINVDKIDVEYTADRRNWGDTSNIMGEYSQTLTSDIDNVAGTKLNKKYGDVGQTSWLWVEDKVDEYGNKYVDIIPTKKNDGGILEQILTMPQGDDLAMPTEYGLNYQNDEKLKLNVSGKAVIYTPDKFAQLVDDKKLVYKGVDTSGNGVWNYAKGAAQSTANLAMSPKDKVNLKKGKDIKKLVLYNKSRGKIADITESIYITFAGWVGSDSGSKSYTQLLKSASKSGVVKIAAHSENTIKLNNAIKSMTPQERTKYLKGVNITIAAPALFPKQISSLETLVKEAGGTLNVQVRSGDLVARGFGNKVTMEGSGGHDSKNYNMHKKKEKETGIYKKPSGVKKKTKEEIVNVETFEIIDGDK